MAWEHKKVKILFDEENGLFTFFNQEKKEVERFESLKEAMRRIDEIQKKYYDFTLKDIKALLKKLDNREKDFIVSMIKELEIHENNAYCELGIYNEFHFDINFREFVKLYDQETNKQK